MRPTREQIEWAAYERWIRRGGGHGHDRHDWIAAENDLLYALNYRVVASVRLDRAGRARGPGRCRFCERTEPVASFGTEPPPLAEIVGAADPLAWVECDECRSLFRESLDEPFARFSAPFRAVPAVRGLVGTPCYRWDRWGVEDRPRRWVREDGALALELPSGPYVPLAAFKFLARLALAALPEPDLDEYAGTIEWVVNADHEFDGGAFSELLCYTYLAPRPFPGPWISLARKIDPDAPHPSLLAFVGMGHAAFQVAIPLGQGDADFDGETLSVPTVSMPGAVEGPPCEAPCLAIPMDSSHECRSAVLELPYRPDALNLTIPVDPIGAGVVSCACQGT